MYSIANAPIKVKASIIRLYNQKTRICTHVFSVFECIEPDMQIRDDHNVFYCCKNANSHSCEKVFYTECVMMLDEAFLSEPLHNYIIPHGNKTDRFSFVNSEFKVVPGIEDSYLLSTERTTSGFDCLFPDVNTPTWIRTWVDFKRETFQFLQKDSKLMKQLDIVSKEKLGFSLLDYHEHVGSIILKWNHRDIKSISIRGITDINFGIAFNFNYRTNRRPKMKVNICQAEQGDCIASDSYFELNNPVFKHIIDVPAFPDLFLLKVYDDKDNLIYHCPCNGLLQKFNVHISTPSKVLSDIKVVHATGELSSLPPVKKCSVEKCEVGNQYLSLNNYYKDAQKVRNVKKDKELGTFCFFDGCREKKESNKELAKEYVRNLLNRATVRCMICDDYFDAPDFGNYLYHVKNDAVELRVLSSLEQKHADSATRLAKIVDSYNHVIGWECAKARMLKGKRSVLHDRFIVCDDEIWAVGASFNELGARASVIYRIPEEAGKMIIDKLEEWWEGDDSVDVHDVSLRGKENSN